MNLYVVVDRFVFCKFAGRRGGPGVALGVARRGRGAPGGEPDHNDDNKNNTNSDNNDSSNNSKHKMIMIMMILLLLLTINIIQLILRLQTIIILTMYLHCATT